MELPKHYDTFIPILETLDTQGEMKTRELANVVRDKYYKDLPQDLLKRKTSSGTNTLASRILWGKSYLKMGKFLEYPQRGIVKITEKGKSALRKGSLTIEDLKRDPDYINHKKEVESKKDKLEGVEDIDTEKASPQDLIDNGFSNIKAEVKAELLDKLKELDPYYFEKVVLILLQKMGYGDFIETSKSNDGGIDGIINEDKLGLEKIYTQAKRYSDAKVREKDIRNFIGAMSGDTTKGVFITTSTFDEGAVVKAHEAHHTIVLIDGNKLVELMHNYGVGVQVKNIYEIKEVDHDFFESEEF